MAEEEELLDFDLEDPEPPAADTAAADAPPSPVYDASPDTTATAQAEAASIAAFTKELNVQVSKLEDDRLTLIVERKQLTKERKALKRAEKVQTLKAKILLLENDNLRLVKKNKGRKALKREIEKLEDSLSKERCARAFLEGLSGYGRAPGHKEQLLIISERGNRN